MNLKEYIINNNIMRNIYLIIIISLLQLSNNNIIEYSNITLKINGIGIKIYWVVILIVVIIQI